jgi:serine/threonine protein kinase/Tfp pilus assembly protein PilF
MNAPPSRLGLDDFVEAFEAAQQRDGSADLADFLPAPHHAQYAAVLRELVCIDLDYGWERGRPTPLDEYRRRFPALFQDPAGLRAVVWEEYRQRRLAGEEPDPEDYRLRYGASPLDDGDPRAGTPAGAEEGPRTAAGDPNAAASGRSAPSEFRLRPGEVLADKIDLLGVGPRAAPGAADLYRAARRSDPAAAERYAQALAAMPEVGETFLGFHLEAELGRGAFGRVFLARQGELANRPVALKIAAELFGEKLTLAQLQHTNIMPIYSAHRAGPFQALCMPYFGGTTLADVFKALQGKALPTSGRHLVITLHGRKTATLPPSAPAPDSAASDGPAPPLDQVAAAADALGPLAAHATAPLDALRRCSYVEAVLRLAARLADGLAHAHERGIVHRDLKPANVLLTDDGQPMLLDFNLSDDTKLRGSEAGARVGGTLPYMAPEQLSAFRRSTAPPADSRSDLYALGLILYELLTSRHPFETPRGSDPELVARMIDERSGPPPLLRPYNAAVSPAVEAVVRRCLEPDPAKRYQSARDLQEDVERHLANRPLKHTPEPSWRERAAKFARRHPRLTSAASVGALAAAVLVALGAALSFTVREVRRHRAAEALNAFSAVEAEVKPRLIRSLDAGPRDAALHRAREAVARYGVFERPDWAAQRLVIDLPPAEQERLRGRVGEMLFLMTQAALDQAPADGPPERVREALRFNDLAAVCYRDDERPQAWWEQRAELLRRLGERDQADGLAAQAKQVPLRTAQDHYLRALREFEAGRYREALAELEPATAQDPRHFWAWLLRGNCDYFLSRYTEAAGALGHCISIDPQQARPYFDRGRVLARVGADLQAADDFRRALDLAPDWAEARIELGLALAREALNRPQPVRGQTLARAEAELSRVLDRPGAPLRCYFQRALVRKHRGDTAGADADFKAGYAHEPAAGDDQTWVIRGYHRKDAEPEKALEDFRRAERINPRNYHALRNEAHVLAEKLQRPKEAVLALDRLLGLYPEMPEVIAERAVVLARLGRVGEAVADAKRLEALGPKPLQLYQAACVYALTADRPGHAKEALRLLALSLSRGLVLQAADPDPRLNPVRVFETDPDLNPLRDRPEFRRLLEAVHVLQSFQKE